MRFIALVTGIAIATLASAQTGLPQTPKRPVVDHYFKTSVVDDYRWLEDAQSAETKEWVKAQNLRARTVLDGLPDRPAILAAKTAMEAHGHVAYFNLSQRSGTYFALKYAPPLEQPILVALSNPSDLSTERVIVNPNALDLTGGTSISRYSPSPDGSKIAVCWSSDNSERGEVHVFDTSTAKEIDTVVPRVRYATAGGDFAWLDGGNAYLYTRYPRPGERQGADLDFYTQIYRHRLGADTASDAYEFGKDFPRTAEIKFIRGDGKWMFAQVANGDSKRYSFYSRNPQGRWAQLATPNDEIAQVVVGRDTLFLLSVKNALQGKILTLPQTKQTAEMVEQAKLIIPPRSDAAIDFIRIVETKNQPTRLFLIEKDGGPSRVEEFSITGERKGLIALPPISALTEFVPTNDGHILFCAERYTVPAECFIDSNVHRPVAISERLEVTLDDVEVIREFATSSDGTQVPFTVIHRKGLALTASIPTIMTGYGEGSGDSPSFTVNFRIVADAGVTWVDCNVRGGSDYGVAWRRHGEMLEKQHTFDDFIGCARRLIELHYTDAQHLVIEGSSAGGLVVGAAITQRPELFKAAVADSGIFDMLRAELASNGQFNATLFGTAKDPAQFRALYAYSPYHHVVDGVTYPDVLLMTGATDAHVDLMNSRKMVARLQAVTNGKSKVLLRTSESDGHGVNTSFSEEAQQEVDILAFEFFELGVQYPPN